VEADKHKYEVTLHEYSLLRSQRKRLGLTQQRVADIASINIRLYQRLESGERQLNQTSFRIGVALSDILELDVHDLVHTPSVEDYLDEKRLFDNLTQKGDEFT